MIGENEERWRRLCEAAAKEQDSERLLELVGHIPWTMLTFLDDEAL
jgi:hypothetical protein